MAKIIKYLFAGVGWAVGGPIGALLGYYLGKAISPSEQIGSGDDWQAASGSHHGPYHNTGTQQDINVALMVLIAALMKADGVVKKSELNYVKEFLRQNYGEERGKELLKVLQQLVQQDIRIDRVCQQIKVNTDYTTRLHMVEFLFGIGDADGELHSSELNMLRLISSYLGLSQRDYASIMERHTGYSYSSSHQHQSSAGRSSYSKDPYRVLGIERTATDDEVKKAYRRMAMKYHPDKVASMNEEMQRNAAEQMKEINEAYEAIKQQRGTIK